MQNRLRQKAFQAVVFVVGIVMLLGAVFLMQPHAASATANTLDQVFQSLLAKTKAGHPIDVSLLTVHTSSHYSGHVSVIGDNYVCIQSNLGDSVCIQRSEIAGLSAIDSTFLTPQ